MGYAFCDDTIIRTLDHPLDEFMMDTAPESDYWKQLLNMVATLIALLAAVAIVFALIKKTLTKRQFAQNDTKIIKILEKRSLTAKSHIYAIGILDRLLIIGESEGEIRTLGDFPSGAHLEALFQQEKLKQPNLMQAVAEKLGKKNVSKNTQN